MKRLICLAAIAAMLDADGDALAPGVYLYRVDARAAGDALTVENASRVERLVIVR